MLFNSSSKLSNSESTLFIDSIVSSRDPLNLSCAVAIYVITWTANAILATTIAKVDQERVNFADAISASSVAAVIVFIAGTNFATPTAIVIGSVPHVKNVVNSLEETIFISSSNNETQFFKTSSSPRFIINVSHKAFILSRPAAIESWYILYFSIAAPSDSVADSASSIALP